MLGVPSLLLTWNEQGVCMAKSSGFNEAIELIDRCGRVLITTHTKPDGDACGSVAVLCDVLRGMGKEVQPLFLSGAPEWYGFLLSEKVPVL